MPFPQDFPNFQAHLYANTSFRVDHSFTSGDPKYDVRTMEKDIENILKAGNVVIYLGSMTINRVEYGNITFNVPHYPHKGSFSAGYSVTLTDSARKKLEEQYGNDLDVWINNHIERLRVENVAKYVSSRAKDFEVMEAKIQALRELLAGVMV